MALHVLSFARMTLRGAKCDMPTMRDMSVGFQKGLLANSIFPLSLLFTIKNSRSAHALERQK